MLTFLQKVKSVDVTGVTKGHGFEGSITRWGHKTVEEHTVLISIEDLVHLGQRTTPGRVYKNKEMPGHMGSAQRTIQNLKVVDVDVEANVIALKGSVPGHRDGFVIVKPSTKLRGSK